MPTRREFLKYGGATAAGLYFTSKLGLLRRVLAAAIPGGTLDPTTVPQYLTPLVIPPAMPRTRKLRVKGGKNIDYYEIAVREFQQQVLPAGLPATTVWSYGSVNHPGTFNYPAFTVEAKWESPVRVKWINQLTDGFGNYRPHLLAVDPTLHWANPPGPRDMRPMFQETPGPYTGPVPIVTHVHGAHATQESDGYAEAWYLPQAGNIPPGYFTEGTWYAPFKAMFEATWTDPFATWSPGSAVFQYPNDQRATTMWYHDHTLGMTRLNVYAGPAGFYILRGGPSDAVGGVLPGPAPALGDPPGTRYYEIPLAIQDRSFNADGALFYPGNRAFFESLNVPPTTPYLDIPFIGEEACDGEPSDISPIWNPEFFGNTMLVNGNTWPALTVEPRRYRFRFLDGCNSRFLILKLVTDPLARPGVAELPFWQIGTEGGFLPAPVMLETLLMAPAERADVLVDFSGLPVGTEIFLINEGPDEPFGGGVPGTDFEFADPATTGQVMKFVVGPLQSADPSTPPDQLILPVIVPLGPETVTRQVSLNEEDSATVRVVEDEDGNVVADCGEDSEPFGPAAALLGVMDGDEPEPLLWMDPITENPAVGATEVWEIKNFTMDAHPIHIHEVQFEVVNRESMMDGAVRPPEPWETGFKDTVIAYPDEITRVRAHFDLAGLYVWHCHIVEHEDNEMMRPYFVGPLPPMP